MAEEPEEQGGGENRPDPRRQRARSRRHATGTTVATGQPVVAIVGYPNVGKSTLFNRLAGRRDAVVDAQPGVTRDRRQAGAEWNGRAFQLLDTGGIDEADPTPIGRQVAAQAMRAIEDADLILFVVDVKVAPTAGDLEVAERLRRAGHGPDIMLVANKCDAQAPELAAENLRSMGLGDVHAISAQHGRGAGDLLDALVARLPDAPRAATEPDDAPPPRSASSGGRTWARARC